MDTPTQPPLISIITVAYNAAPLLEQTIQAVLALDYPSIQYVIIDGGSTDQTPEVLHRYRHAIDTIVSEPDDGIYDAMNKGIERSRGDYLWFLNAGDSPGDPRVLEAFLNTALRPDYLFGDTRLVWSDGSTSKIAQAPAELDQRSMESGMIVSHQSFLPRRSLAPLYDRKYSYIADQKWIVDILRRSQHGLRCPTPVSNYLLGGLSHRRFGKFVVEKIHYSFAELRFWRALRITAIDLVNAARFYLRAAVSRR